MPNLFTKLLNGASNVENRIEDRLLPEPVDGLFNKQDLASARQQGMLHLGLSLLGDTSGMGLGAALKEGAGEAQNAYQSSLLSNVTQNTALKQKQMLAMRQQIGQKYAPQPGDTAKDIMARYPQMYMDYMRAGDLEAAKNVEGIVSAQMQHADSDKLQAVQAGDRIYTFDPKTGIYIPGPERHMTKDEIEQRNADREMHREQMQLMELQKQQTMGEQVRNAWARDPQIKTVMATEPLYQNWAAAYRDSKTGTPTERAAAYKSALTNFIAMTDPKLQIRLGTLQFGSKVAPSLIGQAQMALQRSADGTFPPAILEAMNKHAKEIHAGAIKIYNSRYDARTKSAPWQKQYIDPAEAVFPSMNEVNTPDSPERVNKFFQGWGR